MVARKKGLIIFIIILVIVLIGVGVGAFLYFTTDFLKTSQELFYKYIAQNSSIKEIVLDEDLSKIEDKKGDTAYEMNGEISLKNINDDTDILSKFNMSTNVKVNNMRKKQNGEYILKYKDLNLFNLKYISDGDTYAVKSDEVVSAYLAIKNDNLNQIIKNVYPDINVDTIPNQINSLDLNQLMEITDSEKEIMITTYKNFLLNNISKEKYTNQKNVEIDIEGVKYNAIAYTLSLNETELNSLKIQFLELLKQDSVTLNFILSKVKLVAQNEKYTIENLVSIIDNKIGVLRQEKLDSANINKLTVYVSDGILLKTEIELSNPFKKYEIINKITGTVQTLTFISSEEVEKYVFNEQENDTEEITDSNLNEDVENSVVVEDGFETEDSFETEDTFDTETEVETSKFVLVKTKSLNELVYKLDYLANDGEKINVEISNIGTIETENIISYIVIEYITQDEDFQLTLKNTLAFKQDLEIIELESEPYLLLNECSSEDINSIIGLISQKCIELYNQKKNLIEIVN